MLTASLRAVELMNAVEQSTQAAAEKMAALEAAIAERAAQADLEAAQRALVALQQSTRALADADKAQAEAVERKLAESWSAVDSLRYALPL